jgi:hypothetical protein
MKIFTARHTSVGIALITVVTLAGCSSGAPSSVTKDQNQTNTQLNRYQKNQPIPQSDSSQYRQTAIDVELAQIHGVATTSFFFNQGVNKPYEVCPSVGFPVASTSQLTNPEQVVSAPNNGAATVAQQEPNGVYTGQSTGTYVVCVSSTGQRYVDYAEEFVHTVGGPAHWDNTTSRIVLDGEPTVKTK